MPRKTRGSSEAEPVVQLRLQVETPEQTFVRVFSELNPRAATPLFDVNYQPYSGLRSNIEFEGDSGRLRVNLSDLLVEAPPEVLDGLARILLCKLYRKRIPAWANRAYRQWVHTPETQQRMLGVRKARGRKRMLPPSGHVHDLGALFDRLNERYFGGTLRKPALGWSSRPSRMRLGHYDPAHDAIVVSRIFDEPAAPTLALEYVLFHEMLHLKHPVRTTGSRRCVHSPEFLAEERRFPGYEDVQLMLRCL